MIKKLLFSFLLLGVFVAFPVSSFARVYQPIRAVVLAAKATPTSTPVPVVDSFALFWPMVAGKTMQSKIYFLKTWEEDIRGFFIFGSAQKADYDVFLGIKRMLEAEALIKGNVSDLANQTLDAAATQFDNANSKLTDAKNSSQVDQTTKDEINTRVNNLKMFVNSLMNQYPSYKDKLQGILNKLNSISL